MKCEGKMFNSDLNMTMDHLEYSFRSLITKGQDFSTAFPHDDQAYLCI